MTELEEVRAARRKHKQKEADSLAQIETNRRANVIHDLKAGRSGGLLCGCDVCLTDALAMRDPDPLTCARRRALGTFTTVDVGIET